MGPKLFVALSIFLATLGAATASTAANLAVHGDFSAGVTGFVTGYTLSTQTPYLFANGVHGIFAVIPIGSVNDQSAYGDWNNVTVDPSGGNGNVLVADGATDPNVTIWSETVTVTPNTTYTFTFDAAEISNACCSNAVFLPSVDGTDGTALTLNGAWQQNDAFVWNSGSNTSAVLTLTDTNVSGPYNDFVLTDISFASPTSAAPEPAAWALMLLAIGVTGGLLRLRSQSDREFGRPKAAA